jgi:hypothetical protein
MSDRAHRVSRIVAAAAITLATLPAALLASGDPDDPPASPEVSAVRLSTAIQLDGRLTELPWVGARVATDFLQRIPNEGESATQRTEIRFLFDRDAIYIGARMYDELGPEGVRTVLARRDQGDARDFLQITFDTFHDHVGQTVFAVNPSGVKEDAYGPGGFSDYSWDPVWEVTTSIDSLGWSAEIRIPFSQLRFPRDSVQTWGLQIYRMVSRLNELSMWAFYPSTESGGPSEFGHLEDLRIEAAPGKLELLPYVVGSNARLATADAESPFYSGNDVNARVGVDMKYLLTSNLTLTATVNPDFGQVEVDPAVVNLSAFETYFPERRPFFVEGRGFLRFGGIWCFSCSNVSSLNLFYSRRIGRSPQGSGLAYGAGDYADIPDNTTILGAAKITGRTASGWTIGMLNAVTARARAAVAAPDGAFLNPQVEPLTNYFAGRVVRDFLDGDLQVSAITTSVRRNLDDPDLAARLARHAESGGVESVWWIADRRYRWATSVAVSQVAGDPDAMLLLQQRSARYLQRPDREHGTNGLFTDAYDPEMTAMRGFSAQSRFSKEAGNWMWELNTSARSPGFETNDMGFMTRADFLWMSTNLVRRVTTPRSFYRRYWLSVGGQQEHNFDGDLVGRQLQANASTQFRNYWNAGVFFMHRPSTLMDRMTRGGPVVRQATSNALFLNGSTDNRKPVSVHAFIGTWWNTEGAMDGNFDVGLALRPASNVSLQLGPSFSHSESSSQYVTAVDDPMALAFFGRRYVFADLEQNTVGMDFRLNWTFTPTLTLELYAQPFVSSGRYSSFKEFAQPRELEKLVYGTDVGTIQEADGEYTVDPDGTGPAAAFTLGNPDFNFRSIRGNAVLRWEFRPGSTLFLVWTQSRSDSEPVGTMNIGHDLSALFRAPSDNIFMVKVNYWIGI